MNTSTSNDGLDGSSMMSFAAMESGSNNGSCSQKQPQLWDWDCSNQSNNNNTSATPIVTATTATTSFITNGDSPFWDFQTSLFPMTANFPLYLPVSSDFHHHHHCHDPNGLIKVEDGREGQIGLNLGHRTYFSSEDSLAIDRLFRRSRGLYQLSQHVPRCQAEECKADLSGAKHYHRRHKVCEFHSKATVVVANGLHQRFCQQCSRFHVLSEFDETKRSCRKRLADHNRRRRKPSAPNNSMASSAEEIKEQQQQQTISHHNNSKQICAATVITNNISTGAFSTSCMNTDNRKEHQQQQNNVKVGKGLSLGGAEDGNLQSLDHRHHRNRQSSPATYYHHQHHNLFDGMASGVGSSSSDQANQQPNNPMLHLGQELFPLDLV